MSMSSSIAVFLKAVQMAKGSSLSDNTDDDSFAADWAWLVSCFEFFRAIDAAAAMASFTVNNGSVARFLPANHAGFVLGTTCITHFLTARPLGN